ncbi:MAG: NAD-dependent epimerase/dehydratase family protein [Psychroflexus sp.]|nr:NAD-dependent epimerase/dehydratase family protein [Psychroflexus sp.]
MYSNILIIGASGQIGSELCVRLRAEQKEGEVIASDIREASDEVMRGGPFEILDATDADQLEELVYHYAIDEIYLMAAMLSGTAEMFPKKAWDLNMNTLFNVLDLAKEKKISKVFWPSSIAVFGPNTPKLNTPQHTIMEPTTVYGISKQTGERWCEYYHNRYNVDVRSIRYPGLISYQTAPGGGTTDFSIDLYEHAVKQKAYTSFIQADTFLPMLYMNDAIEATIQIMRASPENLSVHSSYNLGGISLSPQIIVKSIQKYSTIKVDYQPDFRQQIADSWPSKIDDTTAQQDWNWQHQYQLDDITKAMLKGFEAKLKAD